MNYDFYFIFQREHTLRNYYIRNTMLLTLISVVGPQGCTLSMSVKRHSYSRKLDLQHLFSNSIFVVCVFTTSRPSSATLSSAAPIIRINTKVQSIYSTFESISIRNSQNVSLYTDDGRPSIRTNYNIAGPSTWGSVPTTFPYTRHRFEESLWIKETCSRKKKKKKTELNSEIRNDFPH